MIYNISEWWFWGEVWLKWSVNLSCILPVMLALRTIKSFGFLFKISQEQRKIYFLIIIHFSDFTRVIIVYLLIESILPFVIIIPMLIYSLRLWTDPMTHLPFTLLNWPHDLPSLYSPPPFLSLHVPVVIVVV